VMRSVAMMMNIKSDDEFSTKVASSFFSFLDLYVFLCLMCMNRDFFCTSCFVIEVDNFFSLSSVFVYVLNVWKF